MWQQSLGDGVKLFTPSRDFWSLGSVHGNRRSPQTLQLIHPKFTPLEIQLAECGNDPVGDACVFPTLQLGECLLTLSLQGHSGDLRGCQVKLGVLFQQAGEQRVRVLGQDGILGLALIKPHPQCAEIVLGNPFGIEVVVAVVTDSLQQALFPVLVRLGRGKEVQGHGCVLLR